MFRAVLIAMVLVAGVSVVAFLVGRDAASPSAAVAAQERAPAKPVRTPKPNQTPTPTPPATSTPSSTATPLPTATATSTPPPGTSVLIAAAGDIACDPGSASYNGGAGTLTACRQKATSDMLVAMAPAAVLTLGDNQYEDGALSKYQQVYDPSWGREKAKTKPVPGNHEYGTAGALGYFSYYGAAAGDPAKGYYSFNLGSWHLVALNSNCAAAGGCGAGSAQVQWLRVDLAANPAQCTLAYWHHPRFSSGSTHGSDATYTAFWQALYDANADVVLAGHEHNYERFAAQTADGVADAARGLREFVVGTGGKSLYGFAATPLSTSEVRQNSGFGVLKLTLKDGGYEWAFVLEAGQAIADAGSGVCH